ncbi:MAG: diguanylate phosphodiesterase [Rhodopirellula sp.]|nr:diguanylate phosphodiesterase [Rhodopirellula sp.]
MSTNSEFTVSDDTSRKPREWYLYGSIADGQNFQEVHINRPGFRIGRRFNCDLQLTWATVSGTHAEFNTGADDRLVLRDLDSTNGTFVNGKRISGEVVLKEDDIVQLGASEFRVLTRSANEAQIDETIDFSFLPSQLVALEDLIHGAALVPHYQPVVNLTDKSIVGYEVLARSDNPELSTPFQMFSLAEKLELSDALSVACRAAGLHHAKHLPSDQVLLLNTHPSELKQEQLLSSLEVLRQSAPEQAMMLEIHEAAFTDLAAMAVLQERLNDLQIQLAYDDFGAGQARILDLIEVPPDILKFDISLVRDIHESSDKHIMMVQTLVSMVRDFGISPLAEGIEKEAEAETCLEIGFELAQGFHFGRPSPTVISS